MRRIFRISYIVVLVAIFLGFINFNRTIVTENKKVYQENEQVSLRDLAMLASLAYEDVPDANNYSEQSDNACIAVGSKTLKNKNCAYEFEGYDKFYTRKGYKVLRYVEGLSQRKLNWFTVATTAKKEDGELYLFLDYAETSEVSNWKIFDKYTYNTNEKTNGNILDVVVFKHKDSNNYVISYRGTDFQDVFEWGADLLYAFNYHKQAPRAYAYAIKVYKDILKDSNGNANIYVTGHSLGAYLAQVGGAAIVNYEKKNNISNSMLAQVAYFNGMGVTALGTSMFGDQIVEDDELNKLGYNNISSETFVSNIISDLNYLATYNRNGSKSTSSNTLNYSKNIPSSRRLVLYRMDGDPISQFGVHLGEVIEFEPALDSINYHDGAHAMFINGSLRDYAITKAIDVKNTVVNYIEKIKKITRDRFDSDALNEVNYTEAMSTALSNFVDIDEKLDDAAKSTKISDAMPEELKDIVGKKSVQGVMNILETLANDKTLEEKYGSKLSVIERFNIGHETDSFMCAIDGNRGKPAVTSRTVSASENDTNVSIVSVQSGISTVYARGGKAGKTFKIGIDAEAGCIREYHWYEGDRAMNLSTTIDKNGNTKQVWDIISIMELDGYNKNNNQTESYTVQAIYGNKLTTKQLKEVRDGNKKTLKYSDDNTIADIDRAKDYVSTTINVIYDSVGPKCKFAKTAYDVELETKKTFLIFNTVVPKTEYVKFSCTDDGSGFSNSRLNSISKNSFKINNAGLVPSIEITDVDVSISDDNKKLYGTIAISINRKPSFLTPSLELKNTNSIVDSVGNKASFDGNKVKFNITKR